MKREKKNRRWLFAGMVSCILIGMCFSISYMLIPEKVEEIKVVGHGKFIVAVGEYNPGTGASGWVEIYAYPHTETGNTTYAENTSATLEAASLAYADTDGWSDDLVSETEFDIVVRCRFNKTNCGDGSDFDGSRTRVYINVSGDETVTAQQMWRVETANSSGYEFIYENFWINKSSGTGFQISDDGTITVDDIVIEAKF